MFKDLCLHSNSKYKPSLIQIYCLFNSFLIPNSRPRINEPNTPPSIGKPGGGGGEGGGGLPLPCAKHTKLINTNKIEAKIFLFCIFIVRKCIKKSMCLKHK